GKILVSMGFATERAVVRALSRQLGVPEVDLASQTISPAVLSKVPAEICRRHRLFPLAIRRDERGPFLHVAMADPADLEAIDDLRFLTGLRVEAAVAPEGEIHRAIERHYGAGDADPLAPRGAGGGAVPPAGARVPVEPAVAPKGEIHRAIGRNYGGGDAAPFDPRGAGGGGVLRFADPFAVEPAAEPPVRFDPAPAPPASEAKAAEASRRENGTDLFAA